MRLPNGYGSAVYLGKGRRKKYGARITAGWENGKQKYRYIGYYETRSECLKALANYSHPEETYVNLTFAKVYELWSEKKYQTVSHTTVCSYTMAYNQSSELHNVRFQDIRMTALQRIIDQRDLDTSKRYLKLLYGELFDFAVKNEIISKEKDLTEHLEVPAQAKSDRHNKFTNEELKILWQNSEQKDVQIILIMIYTGVRPAELFTLKKEQFFGDHFEILKGKTKNAARLVPIHKDIRNFFNPSSEYVITYNGEDFADSHYYRFSKYMFVDTLKRLGIYYYGDGITHTPYDTRSTFTSLWMTNKLDEPMRRKIQGHSGLGMGEKYYAHFSIEDLIKETNKLPTKF